MDKQNPKQTIPIQHKLNKRTTKPKPSHLRKQRRQKNMKYEDTKCKECNCTDKPLFAIQPMKDNKDYFCEEHRISERKKRAEQ